MPGYVVARSNAFLRRPSCTISQSPFSGHIGIHCVVYSQSLKPDLSIKTKIDVKKFQWMTEQWPELHGTYGVLEEYNDKGAVEWPFQRAIHLIDQG